MFVFNVLCVVLPWLAPVSQRGASPHAGVHIGLSDAVQQPDDRLLLDLATGPTADRRSCLLTGAVHAAGVCLAECDHRPQRACARPVPRRLQSLACVGLDLLHRLVISPRLIPLTSWQRQCSRCCMHHSLVLHPSMHALSWGNTGGGNSSNPTLPCSIVLSPTAEEWPFVACRLQPCA